MAKGLITSYAFDPIAKTITFTAGGFTFDLQRLYFIIHVPSGKQLFGSDIQSLRGSMLATNVLQLTADMTGMGSVDELQISYELDSSGSSVTNYALEAGGKLADIDAQTQNLNTVIGSKTDSSASSDTGNFSLISFFKRLLGYQSNLVATPFATSTLQTSGNTKLDTLNTNIGAAADAVATTDTGTFSLIALIKRSLTSLTSIGTSSTAAKNSLANIDPNLGSTTDSVASTDTGTFSLISLFKRNLTKLTSLIALFPASLGIKTASNSLAVALASDTVGQILLTTNTVTGAGQFYLPATDVGNYVSLSIQLPSTFTGTATVQFSNNNSDWDNAPGVMQQRTRSMTNTMSVPTSIYNIKIHAKYCRIAVLSYVSNSTIVVYASPLINMGGEEIAGVIDSITFTVPVGPKPVNGNGGTGYYLSSAATTNATLMRSGYGMLLACNAYNNSGSVRYLKFFNKNAPPTLGIDNPFHIFPLLPNANNYFDISRFGENYSSGIAFAMTSGAAWNDATPIGAGEVIMNVVYN